MDTATDTLQLLIFDTPENTSEALVSTFPEHRISVSSRRESEKARLFEAIKARHWDILLINEEARDLDAGECLSCIRQYGRQTALVVLTAKHFGMAELASAWRDGVTALVSLEHPEYSIRTIEREYQALKARRSNTALKTEASELTDRCHTLLNCSEEAVAYVHGGMHVYANTAYLQKFGYEDPDDILVTPFVDMVDSSSREALKERLRHFQNLRPGASSVTQPALDVVAKSANGSDFPAQLRFVSTRYNGEDVVQVLVSGAVERPQETPVANNVSVNAGPVLRDAADGFTEHVGTLIASNLARLFYHPVVTVNDIETELHDVELRINAPDGRLLSYANLRQYIDDNAVGVRADRWQLELGLRLLSTRQREGKALPLMFTLTSATLADQRFPAWITTVADDFGLSADAVILNFSESQVLACPEASSRQILTLLTSGFRVCISEYSNTAEVHGFVVKTGTTLVRLKADLCRHALGDATEQARFRGMAASLQESGCRVIATNADSPNALSALWQHKVDLMQGTYFEREAGELLADAFVVTENIPQYSI